ncbi:MAG TPA: hypothetical protein DDX51_00290, partial [Clostridiales bacterium]|nr:hypothetical protein [Clostridiales bacterium]
MQKRPEGTGDGSAGAACGRTAAGGMKSRWGKKLSRMRKKHRICEQKGAKLMAKPIVAIVGRPNVGKS